VANEYLKNREKLVAHAEQLENGLHTDMIFKPVIENKAFSKDEISTSVAQLKSVFDIQNGGTIGAPKFPMPSLYNFLLNYGILSQDTDILAQVELTLQKMAMGGIYDHIGGGFARYSTDPIWKAPHF